ncbi:MAG: hypothetical protein ACTIM0_10885 [Lactococcus cremoris]
MGITKNLQVSVEKKLHDEASSLFSELGLSTGAVVNAMLRRAVLTQSVPFEISKDVSNNQEIENTMKKMNEKYMETFKNLVDR